MKTTEIKYQGNKIVIHWMDKWIGQCLKEKHKWSVTTYKACNTPSNQENAHENYEDTSSP